MAESRELADGQESVSFLGATESGPQEQSDVAAMLDDRPCLRWPDGCWFAQRPTDSAHAFVVGATLAEQVRTDMLVDAKDLDLATLTGLVDGITCGTRSRTNRHWMLICRDDRSADAVARSATIARAGVLARDLGTAPSNVKTPRWLSDQAHALAGPTIDVETLEEDQLHRIGAGGLLAVGAGSIHSPTLTILRYRGPAGTGSSRAPTALVGKGITFDSGGLSLKPAKAMELMKTDMSGAAAVIGTFAALRELRPTGDVFGLLACAENMPSGAAMRPGDVVRHVNGRTTQVLNTDAEGRLVLADALAHAAGKFSPGRIVDLATLTGAATVGLGRHHAALFSDDDELADGLLRAGRASGEPAWRMPLPDEYRAAIDSPIADAANTATDPTIGGGAITAALFLHPFAGSIPWAHLDIAGVGRRDKAEPGRPAGASGYGVRLLTEWLTG